MPRPLAVGAHGQSLQVAHGPGPPGDRVARRSRRASTTRKRDDGRGAAGVVEPGLVEAPERARRPGGRRRVPPAAVAAPASAGGARAAGRPGRSSGWRSRWRCSWTVKPRSRKTVCSAGAERGGEDAGEAPVGRATRRQSPTACVRRGSARRRARCRRSRDRRATGRRAGDLRPTAPCRSCSCQSSCVANGGPAPGAAGGVARGPSPSSPEDTTWPAAGRAAGPGGGGSVRSVTVLFTTHPAVPDPRHRAAAIRSARIGCAAVQAGIAAAGLDEALVLFEPRPATAAEVASGPPRAVPRAAGRVHAWPAGATSTPTRWRCPPPTRPRCWPPAPASRPSTASTPARATWPSAPCGRPATTPPRRARWASACSTTWRSPPGRWPTGASGC